MANEEAVHRFYAHVWPHRALILRTARFLTPDVGDAEDLAQETLMRAFRKIDQLDAAGNTAGWLTTILRNVRIDQTRVRSHAILTKAQELDADMAFDKSSPAEPDARDVETLIEQFSDQVMIEALHGLSEDIRWSVLLVDVQQMSYAEAALILEVPEGTVKSRLHRGRQMLRERLLKDIGTADGSGQSVGRRIP